MQEIRRSHHKLAFFPPSGQIIEETDDTDHVAGNGAAQPVALDAHVHHFAEKQGEADPGHDPVHDAGGEAEGGIADAIEQCEACGAGSEAHQVDDAVDGIAGGKLQYRGVPVKDGEDRFGENKQQYA